MNIQILPTISVTLRVTERSLYYLYFCIIFHLPLTSISAPPPSIPQSHSLFLLSFLYIYIPPFLSEFNFCLSPSHALPSPLYFLYFITYSDSAVWDQSCVYTHTSSQNVDINVNSQQCPPLSNVFFWWIFWIH